MWKWLVSLLKGWGRGGKPKSRHLAWPLAGLAVDAAIGECVPRALRIQFPPTVRHLTWTLDGVSVGATVAAATFTKAGGTQSPPAWRSPMPAISVPQGGSFGLAQLIDNKGAFAPVYSIKTSTLPANVTLDTASGVISAGTGATVGAQTSGVSFQASDAGPLSVTGTHVQLAGLSGYLAGSKHLCFCYANNRHVLSFGDHIAYNGTTNHGNGGWQDGRQEMFSFTVPLNDWIVEQEFYIKAEDGRGDMQQALPDDGFSVMRHNDTTGHDEIWVFTTVRAVNTTTAQRTADCRADATLGAGAFRPEPTIVTQEMQNFCAWDATTRTWRIAAANVSEMMEDRAWRGIFDSVTDKFFIPASGGYVLRIRGSDGVDVTPRYGGSQIPLEIWPWSNAEAHHGIVGPITVGGVRYAYILVRKAYIDSTNPYAGLYRIRIDATDFSGADAPVKVAAFPKLQRDTSQGAWSNAGDGADICFHPGLRVIVVSGSTIDTLYTYNVDTGNIQNYNPRPDSYVSQPGNYFVPPSTIFYDPATADVISIGSIDWANNTPGTSYTRLRFYAT